MKLGDSALVVTFLVVASTLPCSTRVPPPSWVMAPGPAILPFSVRVAPLLTKMLELAVTVTVPAQELVPVLVARVPPERKICSMVE